MKSTLPRYLLVMVTIFSIGLVLIACGAPEAEDPAEPSEPVQPADPDDPSDEFDYNATITTVRGQDPETLDPHLSGHVETTKVLQFIADSLVTFDHDGNIVPLLAKDWDICAEGLTYTFYLREDVLFHSGKPMTSDDVQATFDRWFTIPGATGAADFGAIESYGAVDEYTFEFVLAEPNNVFLPMMTRPQASIFCRDNFEAEG